MSTSSSTLSRSLRESVGPNLRILSANALIGYAVFNRNGETLGQIDDVMMDMPQGRIAYAVMGVGGFLGMGERRVVLPWTALTHDTDRQCFLMDATPAAFETAPGFERSKWPTQPDLGWHEEVHRYYGARPYWN